MKTGSRVRRRTLTTIHGDAISLPDRARLVHLQFRRFAGCPVCNLHLRSFAARHAEIAASGVFEVVVFHSSRDLLLQHAGGLPFAVIADPQKRLYAEFGVRSALRALLDPRAWPGIARAIGHAIVAVVRTGAPVPSLVPEGGRLGLPADFLIAPNGRVVASNHGRHVDDHWSVDELLARVAAAPGRAASESKPRDRAAFTTNESHRAAEAVP